MYIDATKYVVCSRLVKQCAISLITKHTVMYMNASYVSSAYGADGYAPWCYSFIYEMALLLLTMIREYVDH